MNRTIWIFRLLGVAIFLVLTFLMLNLYTKLRRMSQLQPPPPAMAPRSTPQR